MRQLIKDKLAGRTQRWLCGQIGMGDVELSNSINGYRKFKFEEFEAVKTALGIEESDLEEIDLEAHVQPKEENQTS